MKRKYQQRGRARKRVAVAGPGFDYATPMVIQRQPRMRRRNQRTAGFVGIEKKYLDLDNSTATMSTTWAGGELDNGTALCLSAVGQGDGESQRDGRNYSLLSVHIRGYFFLNSLEAQTAPINESLARIALVWDKQTNAAQLNAEDVFDNTATPDLFSFRNLQYSQRFVVLKDIQKRIIPNGMSEGSANAFAGGIVYVPFQINHRFKNPIKVQTNGTGATVASIIDNSLHVIGVAANTTVGCNFNSRVRFVG